MIMTGPPRPTAGAGLVLLGTSYGRYNAVTKPRTIALPCRTSSERSDVLTTVEYLSLGMTGSDP